MQSASAMARLRQSPFWWARWVPAALLALRAMTGRLNGLLSYAHQRLSPQLFERLQRAVTDFENNPSAITSRVGDWLHLLIALLVRGFGAGFTICGI